MATRIPPLNKMTMNLGNNVLIATSSFKALVPAFLIARDEIGIPKELPDPTCYVEVDGGTTLPCWVPAEEVVEFVEGLLLGGGSFGG